MDLLANLNKQQVQAVTAGLGQVLVLAGPGSGKTRVLTQRIAYLVYHMGVRPAHILAVTFTNKAAREMQNRLENLLGESIQGVWLGTFHAMCARILRREADFLPVKTNFVIFDADDQESLAKRAIKELNLDDKLYRPASILNAISNAKNNLLSASDYPTQTYRDEVVKRVYEQYTSMLLSSNAVDFDDLLMVTVKLLRDQSSVQQKYARRFAHVLVDEFQDTNLAQYELLKLLSAENRNLFVVGDEDQSIYRWRGADYRNVLRFEKEFPDCQKILLEQNYRSTQTVLDAARAVIDQNSNRTRKALFTERGTGDMITLNETVDDHAEAAYVVDTIYQQLVTKKAGGGDFAVMYRTNAQSRLLEEAFLRAGMPYRLVGAQRFYGRREVKDIIAYLRLAHNPDDIVSLQRVINTPPRGIGDKTLVALQLTAQQGKTSAGQVLLELGEKGEHSSYWKSFTGRGASILADFGGMLGEWVAARNQLALPALFDRILGDVVYQEYIEDQSEEWQDRLGNVEELRKLAYEFQERGLTEFLENLALVSDQDTVPERPDAPTLLTLHAAKGLEFEKIFIIGLDEGLLPHSRSRDDPEEMAEERRLFYVGITRARNHLFLVRAERRSTFGSYEYSEPSRFLKDIPEGLVSVRGVNEYQNRTSPQMPAVRWSGMQHPESTPPKPVQAVQRRFQAAMHVRHASWGDGIVLESKLIDGEEMVDIFFESVGFKRVVAAIAKLEIV